MSSMTTADPRFSSGGTAAPARQRHWWSPPPPPSGPATISTKRAYLEVLVVFGVFFGAGIASAAFALTTATKISAFGWSDAVPDAIQQVATTVLCVMVPVLLVRRRGLAPSDLGLAKPGTVSPSQGIRMAAWAVLALVAGGAVTTALAGGRSYPMSHSIAYLVASLFHGAQAGFIEEIVVLAFVVVTLEQARRPRPEIITVALLLRVSYHVYYGWGALGIFVWAAVFVWLFLRFRSIIPLIAVHSTWDVVVFLADKWTPVGGLFVLAILGLLITAMVLWLVDRSNRNPVPQMMAGGPGWYPDPGGSGGLRWFDGWAWTSYLHPPVAQRWSPQPPSQAKPPAQQAPWGQSEPPVAQQAPWGQSEPPIAQPWSPQPWGQQPTAGRRV